MYLLVEMVQWLLHNSRIRVSHITKREKGSIHLPSVWSSTWLSIAIVVRLSGPTSTYTFEGLCYALVMQNEGLKQFAMYWETLNAFNQSSTQNLKVVNSATKKRSFRDAQLPIAHIASHSSLSLSQALVRISLWARFRRRTRKTRPFSLRCFSQSLIGFSAQNPLLLDDILDTLSSQPRQKRRCWRC